MDKKAEYVSLTFTGKVTRAEQEKGRAAAVRVLSAKGLGKLVVDATRIESEVSIADEFEFTSEHKSSHGASVRIAVLYHRDEYERFHFIENVARNRGVNLKTFTDPNQANIWLIKE